MKIDQSSLKKLYSFLQKKLTQKTDETRAKIYSNIPSLRINLAEKIRDKMFAAQKSLAIELDKSERQKQLSKEYADKKREVLDSLGVLITKIASFEAMMYCVFASFNKGYNGCQEHADLVNLALIKLFGIHKGPKAEWIRIEVQGVQDVNHAVIILNRAESSDLQDVNTWGSDCLILDSWGNFIGNIDQLEKNMALSNLKLYGAGNSQLQLFIENKFNVGFSMPAVCENEPNHMLYEIEKKGREYLLGYFKETIDMLFTKFGLPELNYERSQHQFFLSEASPSASTSLTGSSNGLY